MKTFEITYDAKTTGETLKIESSSILGALEKAHKIIQIDNGIDAVNYRITRACQTYTVDGSLTGELVRSDYPIIGGPNPDMWSHLGKIKPTADATNHN